jgi:hypothetical protein
MFFLIPHETIRIVWTRPTALSNHRRESECEYFWRAERCQISSYKCHWNNKLKNQKTEPFRFSKSSAIFWPFKWGRKNNEEWINWNTDSWIVGNLTIVLRVIRIEIFSDFRTVKTWTICSQCLKSWRIVRIFGETGPGSREPTLVGSSDQGNAESQ